MQLRWKSPSAPRKRCLETLHHITGVGVRVGYGCPVPSRNHLMSAPHIRPAAGPQAALKSGAEVLLEGLAAMEQEQLEMDIRRDESAPKLSFGELDAAQQMQERLGDLRVQVRAVS
jgi:hypothetical protein